MPSSSLGCNASTQAVPTGSMLAEGVGIIPSGSRQLKAAGCHLTFQELLHPDLNKA